MRDEVPAKRGPPLLSPLLQPGQVVPSFELPFDGREQRRAARALGAVRRLHPALPARLRYVAPYHEALTRLSGRNRPDLATRTLNRLWIGCPTMGADPAGRLP